MPILGVSITKEWRWEGGAERFANIYHYDTGGTPGPEILPGISEGDVESLVTRVAELEAIMFSSDVSFVEGRVWGPVGEGPNESDTLGIIDLDLQGDNATDPYMCLEDTILVRMRTRRESMRSRPVYLRKWYRTMCAPSLGDNSFTEGVHSRTEQMPNGPASLVRGQMRDLAVINLVNDTSFPDRLLLVSPDGRQLPDYDEPNPEVYPYLQTHDVKY